MKQSIKLLFVFALMSSIFLACTNDDNTNSGEDGSIIHPEEEDVSHLPNTDSIPKAGIIEVYNNNLAYDGYILVNEIGNNRVYLMDKNANLVHEWPLGERKIGNDALLLDDGTLLASLRDEGPDILFGGYGGRIQIMDKAGSALWDFTYSNSEHRSHHDVELLPNGNVLAIAWEKILQDEALENGSKYDTDLYPESIIEIDPSSNTIVWEWHAKDHLVQDFDESKSNYGVVADNPELIDLNYSEGKGGNIMHINGLDYDLDNDLIYLSVNFYSEVWVIDHSTTTEVAATHSGGNFGRGGDLIYRFGNPSAYGDNDSERLFVNNHHPNLFEDGKILIFTNGGDLEKSTVYELSLPGELAQTSIPDLDVPDILWSFTDPELYAPRVSGAVRLPNGNTLITEGDYGIWEVTTDGEVVWKFSSEGFFWRAYHYAKDDPAILALDL